MPPIYFKLKYNGSTRRVTFQELPSWLDLASKIRTLSNLPQDKVGVSYFDSDNDEITVSSNEELQDFYRSSSREGDVIKLNVFDLSVPRDASSAPPKGNIDGSGPDGFDIIESGWHPIPHFTLADILLPKDPLSEGPHAFVEAINSDASGIEKDDEDLDSEDGHSTIQSPLKDKGKLKASTFGAASVASLLNEEPGEKLPIHILDHGEIVSEMTASKGQVGPEFPLQSTPKVQTQNLSANKEPKSSTSTPEDPPLPTFDEPAAPNPSPNLYQDLASFLTLLNNVLSSHPELSEGIRHIANHATSGEYWRTYSSSISEAAQRFSHTSEAEANRIEAEAIRKISGVLCNFMRFFSPENVSQTTSHDRGQREPNAQSPNSAHSCPFGHFGPRFDPGNPPLGPRPSRSSRGMNSRWHGGPWARPPHWFPGAFVPPPPPPNFSGPFPPPPPSMHMHMPPPPPPRRPMPPPPHYDYQVPPSFHAPLPASPLHTPTSPAAPLQSGGETASSEATHDELNGAALRGNTLTTEELRAKVEEAKRSYKAQKDAYRQERARRRATRGEIPVGMQ